MKKMFLLGIVFLSIFVIYLSTMDRKVYYLSLGNSSKYIDNGKNYGYSYYVMKYLKKRGVLEDYVYKFSSDDITVIDIINDIRSNKKVGNYTIKNSLIKADALTLWLNDKQLYDKMSSSTNDEIYDYIDGLTNDINILFKTLREYCKEDIVFIGYVNIFNDYYDEFDYLDRKLKEFCNKYDISYVSLSDLNDIDYNLISDKVIGVMNKKLFET